jgi:hypothetical protein
MENLSKLRSNFFENYVHKNILGETDVNRWHFAGHHYSCARVTTESQRETRRLKEDRKKEGQKETGEEIQVNKTERDSFLDLGLAQYLDSNTLVSCGQLQGILSSTSRWILGK